MKNRSDHKPGCKNKGRKANVHSIRCEKCSAQVAIICNLCDKVLWAPLVHWCLYANDDEQPDQKASRELGI